jgi:hypothetical protein
MNKNHYIVKTIFTREECDEILRMKTKMVRRQELVSEFDQKKSTFLNNNFRSNTLTTEDGSGEHMDEIIDADSWVYDRLMENMDIGSYATCDGLWPLHLKEYEVDDEIGMHFDDVRGIRRVAVSISLNDDYEGGVLQFPSWKLDMDTGKDNFEIVDVRLKVGQIVQFPIILLHRLTPITRGVRKQLVTWYTGEVLNW